MNIAKGQKDRDNVEEYGEQMHKLKGRAKTEGGCQVKGKPDPTAATKCSARAERGTYKMGGL